MELFDLYFIVTFKEEYILPGLNSSRTMAYILENSGFSSLVIGTLLLACIVKTIMSIVNGIQTRKRTQHVFNQFEGPKPHWLLGNIPDVSLLFIYKQQNMKKDNKKPVINGLVVKCTL